MTSSDVAVQGRHRALGEEAAAPYEAVFLVGCPRSGTTWMQLLLDQHRDVATAPETQIFAYYLDFFRKQWKREHTGPAAREQGGAGLSRLLSAAEFDDLCRLNVRWVLDKIAEDAPQAAFVVEKSPLHAVHAAWIHRLLPRAWFLHVVRDPRDTAASLMAAGRSWGRGWAPTGAVGAARMWRKNVAGARELVGHTPRYLEVSYEALKADAAGELARVFDWMGVDATPEACADAVERCQLERLREAGPGSGTPTPGRISPRGFFRKGTVGGWREELGRGQVAAIEHVCGDLMDELGYERVEAPGRGRFRVGAHDVLNRVREGADWRLHELIRRL